MPSTLSFNSLQVCKQCSHAYAFTTHTGLCKNLTYELDHTLQKYIKELYQDHRFTSVMPDDDWDITAVIN